LRQVCAVDGLLFVALAVLGVYEGMGFDSLVKQGLHSFGFAKAWAVSDDRIRFR
jgi:hypothetical protein